MLTVRQTLGDEDLARVFVAELSDGSHVEFVESVQPPVPREEKWVLIVSTLKGCPIDCPICDAGGDYRGALSREEILAQIDYLLNLRYPAGRVPVPKLKVQFARMGDPVLNDAVLDVLVDLSARDDLPGLMPCLSTVAPRGRNAFMERLLEIRREHYPGDRFQMQFSLHTTDERARRRLVPVRTWSFAEMARWGERFHRPGERRVTLNFAAAEGLPLDPDALLRHFSPEQFAVKLTPINPTASSREAGLEGAVDPADEEGCRRIAARFEAKGYQTILSIGELRENAIGSNCGMYVASMRGSGAPGS